MNSCFVAGRVDVSLNWAKLPVGAFVAETRVAEELPVDLEHRPLESGTPGRKDSRSSSANSAAGKLGRLDAPRRFVVSRAIRPVQAHHGACRGSRCTVGHRDGVLRMHVSRRSTAGCWSAGDVPKGMRVRGECVRRRGHARVAERTVCRGSTTTERPVPRRRNERPVRRKTRQSSVSLEPRPYGPAAIMSRRAGRRALGFKVGARSVLPRRAYWVARRSFSRCGEPPEAGEALCRVPRAFRPPPCPRGVADERVEL